MADDKVEYTKPNSQLDLEARQALEDGKDAPEVGAARSFAVEGNDLSGYVGVSPEYQNYADETSAPIKTTEGAEAKAQKKLEDALSTDVPKAAPTSDERVEPKQASYNIPAVGPDGAPTGDKAETPKAKTTPKE